MTLKKYFDRSIDDLEEQEELNVQRVSLKCSWVWLSDGEKDYGRPQPPEGPDSVKLLPLEIKDNVVLRKRVSCTPRYGAFNRRILSHHQGTPMDAYSIYVSVGVTPGAA
ncbi:MAG: hypothetical protein CSA25_05240 [Desulfobacter postgatei]|uniref:Uncharacterized protein n=1 Tax=Desulfobacter postgatei TaxID=2293 RepID=A0A2G6MR45_9BACT|nr:MAG: hypothetical protein CSA25_05240 [Desulfobacter postgatei]